MMKSALATILVFAACVSMAAGDMQEAIDRISDCVISVQAGDGVGAGVVVNAEGYAVTCAHVVAEAGQATVTLADGSEVGAAVEASDAERDLALLKLERQNLPAARFAASGSMQPGAAVAAVGSPLGLEGSVTSGVVSAVEREIDGKQYLQIDAALNLGSSGGPVINEKGQIVGLATKTAEEAQNVGFAIPAEDVISFLQDNGVSVMMALGAETPSTPSQPRPKTPATPLPTQPAKPAMGLSLLWVILLPIIISLIVSSLTVLLLARHLTRSAAPEVPITMQPVGPAPSETAQPPQQEEDLSDVDIDLL